MNMRPNSQHPS